jgi:hypothetical protein
MLTITFSWNMDSALQIFWHGRRLVSFFFSFCFCKRALILDFFWFLRVNASLGGTHCETFQKTTHMTSRSSLCWLLFRPACMFWGFGIESASTFLLRCFTRGAGTPPSLLSRFRAPGNLPSLRSLRLASQVSRGRRGHGDEGARGDVSDGNISDWNRHRRTAILVLA